MTQLEYFAMHFVLVPHGVVVDLQLVYNFKILTVSDTWVMKYNVATGYINTQNTKLWNFHSVCRLSFIHTRKFHSQKLIQFK